MAHFSSLFESKLRQRIEDEIERDTKILVTGQKVQTIEQYREAVGRLSALNAVLGYCDEVNDDLSKAQS